MRQRRTRRALGAALAALTLGVLTAGAAGGVVSGAGQDGTDTSDGSATWALATADGDLGTGRADYSYPVVAGEVVADGIVLQSQSDATLKLKVYAADAYTTADGLAALRPAAEKRTDAGGWIAFGEPSGGAVDAASVQVQLEPGASVSVPFEVRVPENASPGDHAAGIVTSVLDESGAVSAQDSHRLALQVYVAVAGELKPELKVSELRISAQASANPFSSGQITVAYTLTNSGNVRLVPTEQVRLAGPAGIGGSEGAANTLPEILPGSYVTRQVTVAGIFPLFRTIAEVEVSGVAAGASTELPVVARERVTIWTIPWLWLGLALILIAVAIGIPAVRAGRSDR
ncbi:MAG: hypothetical protein LBE08_01370 [Bifidobacteriaceae bacterium]|jgi:hypothetical protein|nr:hypothetical protein [Bifidobacteriaceae bacterium]